MKAKAWRRVDRVGLLASSMFLVFACRNGSPTGPERYSVDVITHRGDRVEGAEIRGDETVSSSAGEASVVLARDVPSVACPVRFEKEAVRIDLDRGRHLVRFRCNPSEVELAIGVLAEEASSSRVVLDGREVGRLFDGVLATVVKVPSRSEHELTILGEKDETALGVPRFLRVEYTDSLVVLETKRSTPSVEKRSRVRNQPTKEARPYRVGR